MIVQSIIVGRYRLTVRRKIRVTVKSSGKFSFHLERPCGHCYEGAAGLPGSIRTFVRPTRYQTNRPDLSEFTDVIMRLCSFDFVFGLKRNSTKCFSILDFDVDNPNSPTDAELIV